MTKRRVITFAVVFILAFCMLINNTALAESISEEKRKLMIASGEIPPDELVCEEKVKIKKDEAIKIAKTLLEDADKYEVTNTYLNPKWNFEGNLWNVELYSQQVPIENVSFSIDADDGSIINFYNWNSYDRQQNYIVNITRSEAKEIAEKFLKNTIKENLSTYELREEDPYLYGYKMRGVKDQVIYNFNYVKKIKGIIVPDYTISVGVDGSSGKIRNFNCNRIKFDMTKLPVANDVLTSEMAMKQYKESVNIDLQYVTCYEDRGYGASKPRIKLAYVPYAYINMVDAMTGKAINYDGSIIDTSKKEYKELVDNSVPMDSEAKLEDKACSEEEVKTMAERNKQMVEGIFGIKFENNRDRQYYGEQEGIWNFNWNKYDDKENLNFSISINSKTGHITNIYIDKYSHDYEIQMKQGKEPSVIEENVNWKQGRQKALEWIQKLVPEQYGFFTEQNIEEPVLDSETKKFMKSYNYLFIRVVNGLRYRDNTMSISIDRQSGDMNNFYFNWSDMDFPANSDIIEKEEVVRKYFEGTEPRLTYFFERKYDKEKGIEKMADVPKLVYTFNNKSYIYGSLMVDACTGKLVDWGGREIKIADSIEEPDLVDHWAKRSVELLIAQGILKNPYVAYDAVLTRGEVVKMMSLAKGMMYYEGNRISSQMFKDVTSEDEYYPYIENAIRQEILTEIGEEFKANEKITKEEYIRLLINLIGYSDIAKHTSIFKVTGMKNVSSNYIGDAAICSALDVLPVKDGEVFDGSSTVSYAEAAVSLYKALSFIR